MPDRLRILELALKGLKAERSTIEDEIAELQREVSALSAPSVTTTKRTMSAAARKKISEAMKRRYAEKKKAAQK